MFHDDNVFLYVRFLKKFWFELPNGTEKPALQITYIPERDVNKLRRTYPMGFADTVGVFPNNVQIVAPLTVYNTSDLYDYEEKRDLLYSLLGTNLWVAAFDGYEDCYVNICDISDDIVKYNRILTDNVNEIDQGIRLTPSWYAGIVEQLDPNTLHTKYIDGISVYEPMHVMTTEELNEMLESCTVVQDEEEE